MFWSRIACLAVIISFAVDGTSAESRTSPPTGAVSVHPGVATSSTVFSTIASALASLPNDSSNRTIFVYPGVYSEQIYITRLGPLTIYGYTTDTSNFAKNQVVLQAGVPASTAGSDDASGTLRIHKNDFRMYNVNVTNTFGVGSQAIAISQYGSRVGLYACSFLGYQDTLYANQGTQVYLKSYIEGAVDFIFGRTGFSYFGGNTIGVKAPGCITANGRTSNDGGSYVFNNNKVVLAPKAASTTSGKVYLGRPWGNFSKVIFKNTVVTAPLNQALWSIWNTGDERTNDVFYADYNTTGSGATNPKRPSFATVLTQNQANAYSISSAVGSDYATWVDTNFLV
ncbi:hypothetical protein D9619_008596 [Psilocybe cf. subviscida]|uniref:Pectinesterase n=1 Tax=Psilocybe cf. subviscida TaxID=2480587 RepID=A0A8H5BAR2_9AGAR|nr:hypothetical protein D9619_008596 [Psilocybe cf. subviscida]